MGKDVNNAKVSESKQFNLKNFLTNGIAHQRVKIYFSNGNNSNKMHISVRLQKVESNAQKRHRGIFFSFFFLSLSLSKSTSDSCSAFLFLHHLFLQNKIKIEGKGKGRPDKKKEKSCLFSICSPFFFLSPSSSSPPGYLFVCKNLPFNLFFFLS